MPAAHPVRTHLTAVILAVFAALIARSWLQVELLADGLQAEFAADLSYLVVPPILLLLLLPVLRHHKALLADLLSPNGLTLRAVLPALAIGVLLRVSAWCQLIAGISFGIYTNTDPGTVTGPLFIFDCAEPEVVVLGVAVMVVMVPFIEELTHRGLIQTGFQHRGPAIAILLSSLLFMLAHRQSSWGFAFFAGVVFGVQFWRCKTIWTSLISHATVNGLIQLDWRCLQGQWNPQASQLPLWGVGLTSVFVLLLALSALLALLFLSPEKSTGVPDAPR